MGHFNTTSMEFEDFDEANILFSLQVVDAIATKFANFSVIVGMEPGMLCRRIIN